MPSMSPIPFFPRWLSHGAGKRSTYTTNMRYPIHRAYPPALLSPPVAQMLVSRLHAQRADTIYMLQLSRRAVIESRALLEDARTRTTPPLYVRQIQRVQALQTSRRRRRERLRIIREPQLGTSGDAEGAKDPRDQ